MGVLSKLLKPFKIYEQLFISQWYFPKPVVSCRPRTKPELLQTDTSNVPNIEHTLCSGGCCDSGVDLPAESVGLSPTARPACNCRGITYVQGSSSQQIIFTHVLRDFEQTLCMRG